MWVRAVLSLFLWILGSSIAFGQSEIIPRGKLPEGVTPTRYELSLEIDPAQDRFSGRAKIEIQLDQATDLIWLHGQGLTVSRAQVHATDRSIIPARYSEVGGTGVSKVELVTEIGPGAIVLEIDYTAPFNRSLEGLYKVTRDGRDYVYTQFQPLSARLAFPGFDEPRFKTPFSMSLTVPKELSTVSNGPEQVVAPLGEDRKRVMFKDTAPIPTYLVAIAVGDFDVVTWDPIPSNDIRSSPVPLRGIAAKGKGQKLHHALSNTAAMMEILEVYFGSPYPYAKLDLVAAAGFKSGGMENVGAIFYREDYLLLDENPSIHQQRGYAFIHAHELAHSWFGNLVTPVWWDDLWLNEAFATWMSDKVVSTWNAADFDNRGAIRRGNWAKWSDRLVSARQIRQPIESDHDIVNAFDSITYSKGGSVLAMVERYMSPEPFRDGVRLFMSRHRHGVATSKQFFAALAETAGDPGILRAFRSFLDQAGTPRVTADWSCAANGSATATLRQSRSLPLGSAGNADRRWSVPLCLAYGTSGASENQCLLLESAVQQVELTADFCPSWMLPNSGGNAYLNFDMDEDGWAALIDRLDKLPPSDALAAVSSLQAAYEGGHVGTDLVLRAAKIAAQSPHWDVASAPIQVLRDIKNFVLPRVHRDGFKKIMQEIYRPAVARFDLSDTALSDAAPDTESALLRGDLIRFMALDAEDPVLRGQLARLGTELLGFGADGTAKPGILHPNLRRPALIVATAENGLPFAKRLAGLLQTSRDAVLRNHVIRALAWQTDPDIASWVRALTFDPKTTAYDASQLMRYQGRRADNSAAILEWLIENYDAFVDRIPKSHIAWLPWRVSGLCNGQDRGKAASFFKDRVNDHRGGPKALKNVLEAIDICSAYASAQRANALTALEGRL